MSSARKIVVGITGASGAIYAHKLLMQLAELRGRAPMQLAAVLSRTAPEVWAHELAGTPPLQTFLTDLDIPSYAGRDYRAPFASGSAGWQAMVIVPCSMSTVAKVAHGISDDLLSRTADVMLKERRSLILVPRETPLSVLHLDNLLQVARAGALVLPAMPSFYGLPHTVDDVVGSVVARIVDQLGFPASEAKRWGESVTLAPLEASDT